jgi:hypothetical protein
VYVILVGLITGFLLASFRAWKYYSMVVFIIIIGVLLLALLTWTGDVLGLVDGFVIKDFSWGWIFLIIGILLLAWSQKHRDSPEVSSNFSESIDTIIGML